MRLDKFLKVSRIIKRRTVANEACDAEHITVNGRRAKASYEVKPGDILEIVFGSRMLKVRVLTVKETVGNAEASELYEVISSESTQIRNESN
ncbi:MAG: RNA-binding S4 domain-containing protein [Clostridia bacterium]|nr:RNA-binding S4 domain-containing protein [Clostridia bacterium]